MGPLAHLLMGFMVASLVAWIATLEMATRAEKARSILWEHHFNNASMVFMYILLVSLLLNVALLFQPAF